MSDHYEMLKTLTVNVSVLGVTWLSSLEMFLKISLLVLSIIYTVVKIHQITKEK
tara:strand:- start:2210 stop:2371 length:162 start_codon:yes stop_codon:yes gene_type:complete